MHEFSVMTQIVEAVIAEAKKRDAHKIERVELEVGEFTMLGSEQLRFAFEVLSKNTILRDSDLEIRTIRGKIKCESCGFEGGVLIDENTSHRSVPILECPKCHSASRIVEGRECVVRNIRMVVPDV